MFIWERRLVYIESTGKHQFDQRGGAHTVLNRAVLKHRTEAYRAEVRRAEYETLRRDMEKEWRAKCVHLSVDRILQLFFVCTAINKRNSFGATITYRMCND
ncbi:hypothetical protein JOD55_000326 [Arcanobacterium pluranimalium]|nr:hypothetical protein [Arcanobacterium pluranimalium]